MIEGLKYLNNYRQKSFLFWQSGSSKQHFVGCQQCCVVSAIVHSDIHKCKFRLKSPFNPDTKSVNSQWFLSLKQWTAGLCFTVDSFIQKNEAALLISLIWIFHWRVSSAWLSGWQCSGSLRRPLVVTSSLWRADESRCDRRAALREQRWAVGGCSLCCTAAALS